MSDELFEKVMSEVLKKMNVGSADTAARSAEPASRPTSGTGNPAVSSQGDSFTEFVGIATGDTIGLVIPSVDDIILDKVELKKYRAIGIIGARTGAGPQLMAADEAVKATKSEVILFELPRDTKGQGGHGCLILFGADDVSDVRRAVEISLRSLNDWCFGDIYANDAGFCELQYTARASHALNQYMNAPLGKAFGLIVGCPAGVGFLMADTAVKAAKVEVVLYGSPAKVTSFSNEFMIMISGDAGAVKQAVIAGREMGIKALTKMDKRPESLGNPYIG